MFKLINSDLMTMQDIYKEVEPFLKEDPRVNKVLVVDQNEIVEMLLFYGESKSGDMFKGICMQQNSNCKYAPILFPDSKRWKIKYITDDLSFVFRYARLWSNYQGV